MKKKNLAALLMAFILLMGTASAAWSPVDFAGGSLSGIVADGDDLLVSDVFNKVVWRISGDKVEQAVGQISIPGLDGEPIGPKKVLDALIIAPCTGNTIAKYHGRHFTTG